MLKMGLADLNDITLLTDKPEAWTVFYNPDTIDSIQSINFRETDVIIDLPVGTTDGDYMITITAKNDKIKEYMDLWVTVTTPRYGDGSALDLLW